MRKSARTQIPPFFDNDPYRLTKLHSSERTHDLHVQLQQLYVSNKCKLLQKKLG